MTMPYNWSECFEHGADGVLYWKHERPLSHFRSLERLRHWKTRFSGKPAGAMGLGGYTLVRVYGKLHRAHRVIWEMHNGPIPEGMQIDHVNGHRNDNRIENLRLATHTQNCYNTCRPSHNTSGIKGVSWSKSSKKWKAQIKATGHSVRHIGYFHTPEEAKVAYDNYVTKLHGEFASTH